MNYRIKRAAVSALSLWWVAVLAALVTGILIYCFGIAGHTPLYTAHASVWAKAASPAEESCAASLAYMAKSAEVASELKMSLNLPYSLNETSEMTEVLPIEGTDIVEIRVTSPSPAHSAAIANSTAEYAILLTRGICENGEFRITEYAVSPAEAEPSPWLRCGWMGGISVFLLTAVIIFVLCLLDKRIKSGRELEGRSALPLVAEIPFSEAEGSLDPLRTKNDPLAEAYKVARTNLIFGMKKAGERRLLLICSPRAGEGKSSAALNLAKSFAKAGRKVLLIDGDMRMPSLHKALGLPLKGGLRDMLEAEEEPIIHKTKVEKLFVMTAGEGKEDPADLLLSDGIEKLIEKYGKSYDCIFFDSPPILAVTDGALIASKGVPALLVQRWGKSNKDDGDRAINLIEQAEGRLIGQLLSFCPKE